MISDLGTSHIHITSCPTSITTRYHAAWDITHFHLPHIPHHALSHITRYHTSRVITHHALSHTTHHALSHVITKALTTQQSQCKRNRSRSESGERAGKKGEDGKFTLLVEKSEKSNEFGVTVKDTDTEYPVITAVQKGKFEVFSLKSMSVLS